MAGSQFESLIELLGPICVNQSPTLNARSQSLQENLNEKGNGPKIKQTNTKKIEQV